MTMIRVFELATAENFFEIGYLMANPDVDQFAEQSGHTGRFHYDNYGHREGRRQFTAEFVSSRYQLNKAKYYRFRDIFKSDVEFSWLKDPGRFPISSSSKFFSTDDYAGGESANGSLSDFVIDIQNNPAKNFIDIGCGLRDEIYENCLYRSLSLGLRRPGCGAGLPLPAERSLN